MAEFTVNNQFDLKSLVNRARKIEEVDVKFKDLEKEYRKFRDDLDKKEKKIFDAFIKENGLDIFDNQYFATGDKELKTLTQKAKSALGTPIFMPVKLDDRLTLPNEPLVTITGEKKIVRTLITGTRSDAQTIRRGTIKELINTNDYNIKIVGRVVDEDGHNAFPTSTIAQIREMYETRRAIKIDSLLTQLLGIQQIAIYRIKLPGEAGMLNNQYYELHAYSDEDLETQQLSLGVTDIA